MKQMLFFIIINILLQTQSFGQQNEIFAQKDDGYKNSVVTADTTKISSDGDIDGIRNEINAQKTGIKKADSAYRNLGFKSSVSEYLKGDGSNTQSKESMLRVANSFRLNSQTEEAEYWYSHVINEHSTSKDMLRYAQVLQSNGKCEDATRWYKLFEKTASRKEKRNRDLVINCEDLENITNHELVQLENIKVLNTGHLDFSPIPYKDGIIFSSTRSNRKAKEVIDSWTDDNFSDLFYSEYNPQVKNFSKPIALKGDLNKQFHDGAATFDQSGMVMFFTRNNNNGKSKSKQGLIDLKVYSAFLDDGYWTNVTELPFNSDEFTSCHPTLSADGRRLYFASNRPGGYGGLDIYVSRNLGGQWQKPENLGPIVNSAGNELFPVIHGDETLYYASNGHRGLGGLDIFYAQKNNIEDEYSWSVRENLGTPFNSTKDDFGFVLVGTKNQTGFLTSNREGGVGRDDIYTWTMDGQLMEDLAIQRSICVSDQETGERLSNAVVTVSTQAGEEEDEDLMLTLQPLDEKEDKYILGITGRKKKNKRVLNFATDEAGIFDYTAEPNTIYNMTVKREGYQDLTTEVSYFDLKKNNDYCLPMTKKNCRMLTATVMNKKYDALLPNTEVEVWNKCTNQKDKYTTDETGTFEICVPCHCEFRLMASKSGFDSDTEFVSTIAESCESEAAMNVKLELGLRSTTVVATPTNPVYQKPAVRTVPITTYEEVTTYVPKTELVPVTTYVPITDLVNNANTNLSVGQLITLKDIYYDFNKFNIRIDASIDLANVYTLLKKYPSLEIELMSHTDSRGTQDYNVWLSTERAKAARGYLIQKGIAAHRVKAAGYGEKQLKNHCADGVKCSETEHQMNRRTEVKVIKFEEGNVNFK